MKILITGGTGFIGSALIRHLLEQTDATVINVDMLTYAACPASLSSVESHERYVFERLNICDAPAMQLVLSRYQPDAVMHLAAESHVDRSIDGPAVFMQTNIMGTYTLLEAARVYWSGLEASRRHRFRFHQISTDEVFGDLGDRDCGDYDDCDDDSRTADHLPHKPVGGHNLVTESRDPFTERSPYRPSSPYSASKAAADHLVRAWGRTYGLPVLISHCTNNYGPWQYPEKLIPLAIRRARDGQPIPVYGDGQQVRDWLYVDDHARALNQILRRGRAGQTYNVSASDEQCNLAVVQMICDEVDQMLGDRQRRCLIRHVADRPGHDRRYALDASLLRNELGWQPRVTFRAGLKKTVQWYLEHGFSDSSVRRES